MDPCHSAKSSSRSVGLKNGGLASARVHRDCKSPSLRILQGLISRIPDKLQSVECENFLGGACFVLRGLRKLGIDGYRAHWHVRP